MTQQRRAFALWLGIGSGGLVVLADSLTRRWPFPENDATVDAFATGPSLSVGMRLAILLAGAALIAGAAGYLAITSIGRPPSQRVRFTMLLGILAPIVAAANIYLIYHPLLDPGNRPPIGMNLLLTLSAAGLIAGVCTSVILQVGTALRTLSMAAAWTGAGLVAAYVSVPVLYLLGGALTDLSEGLGIGPRPGSILGGFLAGYVIGYVAGLVAGFSMPGTAAARNLPPIVQ